MSANSLRKASRIACIAAFEETGNPFANDGKCLYALDTHDVCSDDVTANVFNIESLGGKQFNVFVTDRLIKRSILVTDPLQKNKLNLFKPSAAKKRSAKIINLQQHAMIVTCFQSCILLVRLVMGTLTRSSLMKISPLRVH